MRNGNGWLVAHEKPGEMSEERSLLTQTVTIAGATVFPLASHPPCQLPDGYRYAQSLCYVDLYDSAELGILRSVKQILFQGVVKRQKFGGKTGLKITFCALSSLDVKSPDLTLHL